jgi:2-polyprenyl-3-methyl-5-hydroxy-6-metoxy-1,4-benzoquinol methylase
MNSKYPNKIPCTSKYLYRPILDILLSRKAKTVLDIGCGNGSLAKYLSDFSINIVGFDPDENNIKISKKNCPQSKFYCMSVYDDPQKYKRK